MSSTLQLFKSAKKLIVAGGILAGTAVGIGVGSYLMNDAWPENDTTPPMTWEELIGDTVEGVAGMALVAGSAYGGVKALSGFLENEEPLTPREAAKKKFVEESVRKELKVAEENGWLNTRNEKFYAKQFEEENPRGNHFRNASDKKTPVIKI